MNLPISGDSVIYLLTKRYSLQPVSECGSVIGVDDFAFKKRHTYRTIIVDQATHRSVAILDGRDVMTLKDWLKNNQQIKTVHETGQMPIHLLSRKFCRMLCR